MLNSRSKALGLAVILLFLSALLFRNGSLAWMALPFLSYLGVGLVFAPQLEDARLIARRSCDEITREGKPSIEVVASLRNMAARTIRVRLIDPPMPGMTIIEGALESRSTLGPGEEAELRYRFEARRGRFFWEGLRLRIEDPLGLFEFETSVKAGARILIQPRYRKMPSIPLNLQKTLSSPGSVPIRLGGSGTDFWGIREYRQGDPLKRLYWRLNARNPLRRYTKEFIQERTAEIVLVLDGRQRMDLAVGDQSLFELEVEATASLAAMLLRQGQRVGLCIIGTTPRNVFPDYGKIQLRRILNCLAEAGPEGEGSRDSLHYLPALRYSRSAFMMILSPFAKDDDSVFQRLRALGYQAILLSPDALDFARPTLPGGSMNELALRACRIERKLGLDRVARLSFSVVEWRAAGDWVSLLKRALALRRASRQSTPWKI
jgi:uncharacterized protein (DUF58 family)